METDRLFGILLIVAGIGALYVYNNPVARQSVINALSSYGLGASAKTVAPQANAAGANAPTPAAPASPATGQPPLSWWDTPLAFSSPANSVNGATA